MLWEFWHSLTTPAPAWARRAGLLHQSIALEARYRRCRSAWDAHYARCRAVIEQAAQRVTPGGTVVVLGSGLLLDVPLDRLHERFEHILLVDAVHPLSARRRLRAYPRARMVSHDLSGCLTHALPPFAFPEDARLVVSLNLLSQLSLPFAEDEARARQAIAWHLRLLDTAPACCLISDTLWRIEYLPDGGEDRLDPWHGLPVPAWPRLDAWTWEVAPPGEIGRNLQQRHEVCAWLIQSPTDENAEG